MRLALSALGILGVFALGCAAVPPPKVAARKPAAGLDVAGILRTTTRVRGLSPIGDVDVELLGDTAFLAKARALEVEDPSIVLLDLDHHALWVRRSGQDDPAAVRELVVFFDALLVQDNFKLLTQAGAGLELNQLRLGLLFADELLTWVGVDAARNGLPVSRAIARAGAEHVDLKWEGGHDNAWNAQEVADVLARGFLGDLYRTGGFPLVNRMLAHAPTESRALASAQAWLDGLERVTFDPPFPGAKPERFPFGAVGMVTLALRSGADDATARALATGLRYGTFELGSKGDDADPFRMVFAFDDEARAAKFHDLIIVKSSGSGSGSGSAAAPTQGDGGRVGAKGTVVAVAWPGAGGTSEDIDRRLTSALATAPSPAPRDAPPLGVRKVPAPLPALPDTRLVARIQGDSVTVPVLGLDMTAPFTFHPQPSTAPVLATFSADGTGTILASAFSTWKPESTAAEFGGGLKKHGRVVQLPSERAPPGWRRWDYDSSVARVMLVQRPICDGAATLMLAAFMLDPSGVPFALDWIAKLDLARVEDGSYCASVGEEQRELDFPAP